MGGELRKEPRARGEQLARAGRVAEIGHRLAGEHRIIRKPALLRALDLGVPIGALDQPHHQPAVERGRGVGEPVDHCRRAFLIGLHRKPKTLPALQRRIGEHGRDHIERQLETVGLFRVDGEIEVVLFALRASANSFGTSSAITRLARHRLVARMQRGELDRNSRTVRQARHCRRCADGVDRVAHRNRNSRSASAAYARLRPACRRKNATRAGARTVRALRRSSARARNASREAASPAAPRCGPPATQGASPDFPGSFRRLARLDQPRRDAERPGRGRDQQGFDFTSGSDQSAADNLSSISRSAVSASGTRNSASASTIRARPSWVESE